MKTFKYLAVPLLFFACSVSFLTADPIPYTTPGGNALFSNPDWNGSAAGGVVTAYTYLGTYAGNDDLVTINAILTGLGLSSTGLTEVGKLELGPFEADPGLTITGSGISGTWSYTGSSPIQFLVLKAGTSFALYQLTAPYVPGTVLPWNTWDLPRNANGAQRDLSHYTLYGVPEPATLLLLGAGLIGLGLFGRKR